MEEEGLMTEFLRILTLISLSFHFISSNLWLILATPPTILTVVVRLLGKQAECFQQTLLGQGFRQEKDVVMGKSEPFDYIASSICLGISTIF